MDVEAEINDNEIRKQGEKQKRPVSRIQEEEKEESEEGKGEIKRRKEEKQVIENFAKEYQLPVLAQTRLKRLFSLQRKTFLLNCIENSSPYLANHILLEKFKKLNYKFCFMVDSDI